MEDLLTVLCGGALEKLRELPDESVQTCVTSPPYWGLRDYGTASWEGGDQGCDHKLESARSRDFASRPGETKVNGYAGTSCTSWSTRDVTVKAGKTCPKCGARRIDSQLGLEKTPEEYVAKIVDAFREERRVLKEDGTLWLNLGDSYANDTKWGGTTGGKHAGGLHGEPIGRAKRFTGLKGKDLIGIPWMVAFALRQDGWYLRSDIIWLKPNPMPESVTDRPTKAHEYLFLLSKSRKYFYNAEAIKENVSGTANARRSYKTPDGWDTSSGEGGHGNFHRNGREKGHTDYIATPRSFKGSVPGRKDGPGQDRRSKNDRLPGVCPKSAAAGSGIKANESFHAAVCDLVDDRNKRSVWTVATAPYPDAHFATYPPDLIKPCILAGCPVGGTVIDPFAGSGTTGMVALELGRKAILIELNPEYVKLIHQRCNVTPGLALA